MPKITMSFLCCYFRTCKHILDLVYSEVISGFRSSLMELNTATEQTKIFKKMTNVFPQLSLVHFCMYLDRLAFRLDKMLDHPVLTLKITLTFPNKPFGPLL